MWNDSDDNDGSHEPQKRQSTTVLFSALSRMKPQFSSVMTQN